MAQDSAAHGTAHDAPKLRVAGLRAGFDDAEILKGITIDVQPKSVLAVIGPSGCGKSTFVRCLNRMHEVTPGAWAKGSVLLDGADVRARATDPVALRRRVGMVFQKPNPFPSMSVRENVLAGLTLTRALTDGIKSARANEIVERALTQAALLDEVKDRLDAAGASLSGGQQQRLCIARALAVEPEVLLMDEPCSALDPISTARIEDLLAVLKRDLTIVIVTHNMQQAARASDRTAFFLSGELVEEDDTKRLFTQPRDRRTEDYITGRFG